MTTEYRSAVSREMTERELQRYVETWLKVCGWRYYHTWNAKHSAPGFPDLFCVRENRVLAIELKSERGRLRPEQRDWLDDLAAAGIETHVVRPSDWLDGWQERVLA